MNSEHRPRFRGPKTTTQIAPAFAAPPDQVEDDEGTDAEFFFVSAWPRFDHLRI
jgi:hypothetical protein